MAEEAGVPSGAVHIESSQFVDHWKAKTGKDATALDWPARWRTWCRNSVKWTYSKQPSGQRTSKHDLSRMNYTEGVDADGKF